MIKILRLIITGVLFVTSLAAEDFILKVEGGEDIVITVEEDGGDTHCYARYESLEPHLGYELIPVRRGCGIIQNTFDTWPVYGN